MPSFVYSRNQEQNKVVQRYCFTLDLFIFLFIDFHDDERTEPCDWYFVHDFQFSREVECFQLSSGINSSVLPTS